MDALKIEPLDSETLIGSTKDKKVRSSYASEVVISQKGNGVN